MIYGVMIRTIHFRLGVVLRRKLVVFAFLLQLIAITTAIYVAISGSYPSLPAILFLLAGVLLAVGLDAFKRITSGELYKRMNERDRVRYLYFSKVFIIAFIWLFVGLILNVLYGAGFLRLFSFRDAFIHSITVGFIANTIMAYAPIILPPLLTGKTPYKGLNAGPAYLLNLGNLWRIGGMVAGEVAGIKVWITPFSGLLIIAAMTYFVMMVHSLEK